MAHIPVTIVTGFLGSGKTTLLNRALQSPRLRRTLVIVNEFGDVGLDHDLIEASRDSIILLPNGCLCCSLRGELIDTLTDIHKKRQRGEIPAYDLVVIETSGLAEPSPVMEALVAEPGVRSCFRMAGIVTTVDAVNGMVTLDAHEQSLKQVALADRIIITKSDLESRQDALRARLRQLNPDCELLDAGNIDPAAALRGVGELDAPAVSRATVAPSVGHHSHNHHAHHHDSRIQRFSIVREDPWNLRTLQMLMEALTVNAGPALLRVKGIIGVSDSPDRPAVVHGAQKLVHTLAWLPAWPSADRRTRIMFITLDWSEQQVTELIEDIERLARRTREIRQRAVA